MVSVRVIGHRRFDGINHQLDALAPLINQKLRCRSIPETVRQGVVALYHLGCAPADDVIARVGRFTHALVNDPRMYCQETAPTIRRSRVDLNHCDTIKLVRVWSNAGRMPGSGCPILDRHVRNLQSILRQNSVCTQREATQQKCVQQVCHCFQDSRLSGPTAADAVCLQQPTPSASIAAL